MIKHVIWIDKNVYNSENQGYKKIMELKYGLKVHTYNDARLGITAIKNAEIYYPIFIITSGTIYPEFYKFFKGAVSYIKNLPVQIIFTSNSINFFNTHKNDEIGRQVGKFYNLGGVTDQFSQVEDFITAVNYKLASYKERCLYSYQRAQNFTGLQTFTYMDSNEILYLPIFFKDIVEKKPVNYKEIIDLINFMLTNFGNSNIANLLKGMILFNDIPEPILSKFLARAYTLESPFYGIMNQNLMKKNFNIYSTYIKLLYKGIDNYSYQPKTDCYLYRGTKLEKFEIDYLRKILSVKNRILIYTTSFLSFSTDNGISQLLSSRRESSPNNREIIIQLMPLSSLEKYEVMNTNAFLNKISFFHNENEVLFFPYSSFELVSIKESEMFTFITFKYSLKFKEKVQNCIYA